MKKTGKGFLGSFLGVILLTACSTAGTSTTSTAISSSATPIPTVIIVLPTFSSSGNSILWQDVQVSMEQAEITTEFITEFGSTRIPSPGEKLLWVHVQLKNTGSLETDTPPAEHFSALYAGDELKPTYGHRKDHIDYLDLEPSLFPDQGVDAWLRFDIPVAAELTDLRFVFIPQSSQIGASFGSPNYPYAEDHPTFVWNCGQ